LVLQREAPAIDEGIRQEVEAPALVRPLRDRQRRPGVKRPFASASSAHLQPFLTIEAALCAICACSSFVVAWQ
jgi:hypothetical protein